MARRNMRSYEIRTEPKRALLKTETLLGVMALSFIITLGVSVCLWGIPQ